MAQRQPSKVEGEEPLISESHDAVNAPEVAEDESIGGEIKSMLTLAFPIFLAMVSWVAMKVTDTALLGHAGKNGDTRYLEASAMSDLWTSSSGVFIQGGVLSIFCGQALGASKEQAKRGDSVASLASKRLVGIWLQVSISVVLAVSIPVLALWLVTGPVLRAMGQSEQIANDAWYYAGILSGAFPARIVFGQMRQFFSAQKITHPEAVCSVSAMLLNLIFGLIMVLGVPIPGFDGFGFHACPIVTVSVEYVQMIGFFLVFCVYQQLHKDCWFGWTCNEITWARIKAFLKVYIPAALSLASDFWRLSAIGAIAATLGPKQVGVFNASYRILWICIIFIGALAAAMSIKLASSLGSGDAVRAKRTAMVGMGVALSVLSMLAVMVFIFIKQLAQIFTSDPDDIELFVSIRAPLAGMMVVMNFSVLLEKIPLAMKQATTVLYAGMAGSWAGQVPLTLAMVNYWRKDLVGLYTGVACGYGLLVLLLGTLVLRTDWDKAAADALEANATDAGPVSDTENPSEDQLSSVATPKGYTLTKVKAEVVASTCMSVTPSSSCHHPVDVDDLACPHAEDNPLST